MPGISDYLLGEDYRKAASFLFQATCEEEVEFRFDGPVAYLFAHGLELMLKAGLKSQGEEDQTVKGFKHNIEGLYLQSKKHDRLKTCLGSAERYTREKWIRTLRLKRDELKEHLGDYFDVLDEDERLSMGAFTNEEIGQEAPSFWKAVLHLSDRHQFEGGSYRYYGAAHLDKVPVIQIGNTRFDVVAHSLEWGLERLSEEIYSLFREMLAQDDQSSV